MAFIVNFTRIEPVATEQQDYKILGSHINKTVTDQISTDTSGNDIVLKADGLAWNSTGNQNRVGGRLRNIDGYRQTLKTLGDSGITKLVKPVNDRYNNFMYLSGGSNKVRKYKDITGTLTQTILFDTFFSGGGYARQGGASDGTNMVFLRYGLGGGGGEWRMRHLAVDIGDILIPSVVPRTSEDDGGMAGNNYNYVFFGIGTNHTECEMARFDTRGSLVTMQSTVNAGTGYNRGGCASIDGDEWYDLFANSGVASERKVYYCKFDSSVSHLAHASNFGGQQGNVYAPQGDCFGTDLYTGRNVQLEKWNMVDKSTKAVIGNTGVGSTPSQTWRGDRADTFIMFGNATNSVRSYNALTAATTLHTPTIDANNGACVQGGY